MLTGFMQAFRTPDLRKKLLFTLFIIAMFRLGCVPADARDLGEGRQFLPERLGAQAEAARPGVFQLVNLFSGGALLKLSVFALGIMPYITASIILQLLAVVIPRLETLRQEGQSGQAKITQYTRYLTVGLAILQSTGVVALARSGNLFPGCPTPLIPNPSVFTITTMVVCMTAGTAVIMWLGELITDRGVGNGMSLMIFTQVIAVIPGEMVGSTRPEHAFIFSWCSPSAWRSSPSWPSWSRRSGGSRSNTPSAWSGRKMYGGTSTYIPLKVNQAGVIPVIFASSLLYIPQLAPSCSATLRIPGLGGLDLGTHLNVNGGDSPYYMGSFFILIVFFTYFYVSITFNPVEVADNMKKYGGFIPGIRPGRPTAEYLNYVLTRLTAPGSVYLACVALIPMVAIGLVGASSQFPLGGTSILIAVGVGLDTVKQIESQLQQRNYEGFLR